MKHQFLEAGRIVRTHGVRGELVLECWADSPEFVAGVKHLYFDGGKTDAGVVSSRVHKGRLLLKLRGVDTVEQGDALRGKVLYLNREDVRLEEGQVFTANGWEKPAGLCQSAWDTLSPFVMALSHGAEGLYDGWMKNPRSAMLSCNDGFRPVSFLVEALDEEAD